MVSECLYIHKDKNNVTQTLIVWLAEIVGLSVVVGKITTDTKPGVVQIQS